MEIAKLRKILPVNLRVCAFCEWNMKLTENKLKPDENLTEFQMTFISEYLQTPLNWPNGGSDNLAPFYASFHTIHSGRNLLYLIGT